jgi:hypothetical protein
MMNRLLNCIVLTAGLIVTPASLIFAQVDFAEHPVADNVNEPWSVYPVDMDGDQDVDIVGSARLGHQVAWWENDGNQGFTMQPISYVSYFAMGIEAADIDNDDDIDVICASQTNGVELWSNSGDQNFTRSILGSWPFASFLYTEDVDDNGYIDVLVACCEGGINRMGWIENSGDSVFTDHIVISDWDHANSVYAEDIDSDGDVDLLGTASGRSTGAGEIAWFENDGNQVFTMHTIYATSARPSCAIARDLDLDGDIDVVAAVCLFNQIMWFENDGSEEFTQHGIGYGFGRPHSVDTADFDRDGDIDVLAGAIDSDKIAWLENDGTQTFTQHEITTNFDGAADVYVADVDRDEDPDVLGTAHYADQIKWWENLGPSGIDDNYRPPLVGSSLKQNFPNPFNPSTTITFDLPGTVGNQSVSLTVYDIRGREVRTLVDRDPSAGTKTVVWDGRDNSGRSVGSGVYIYRIRTGDTEMTVSRKMVVVR